MSRSVTERTRSSTPALFRAASWPAIAVAGRRQASGREAARRIRVAFVNTHPIQYFAPLYAELNRSEDLSVTAIYMSDYSIRGAPDRGFGDIVKWDIDLLAGYDACFLRGAEGRDEPTGFFAAIAPDIWRTVRTGRFDALVLHGHTPAAVLVAAAAARASGIPILLRCETHLGLRRSRLKELARKLLIGTAYSGLDGVLAIGSANRAFYRAIGVPDRRIFDMPYTVDNSRFTVAARLSGRERADLRSALGVADDRPIILYAGKFQRRKHPDSVLRAAARLREDGVRFHLAMVGAGEMDVKLRDLARQLCLPNVHFAGFVNQDALPRFYAACDVFVLPSENEPWGLAVNEAMCAGLPIVAASEIGCVPDLVHHDENGRTFTAGDVRDLADALRPLLVDPGLRGRMGRCSREIIARWSYAECRTGLLSALASAGLTTVADPATRGEPS